MEFLRFGSSIPGSYWGCCACCIIQNFKVDPNAKASIELVSGDGGGPLGKFAGPTYKDIFLQRLRIGTFSTSDMPNHAFFAILTESQISGGVGKEWLKILKEEGFEFIRSVDNSVYTGSSVVKSPGSGSMASHVNHIFGLFRNIGSGSLKNQYQPPKAWSDLPSVVPEMYQALDLKAAADIQSKTHDFHYGKWSVKPHALMTRAELEKMGVPITLAGRRSPNPQQLASVREAGQKKTSKSPFVDVVAA